MKRIVLIAAGRTEQEALPILLRELPQDVVILPPVLIPPNGAINGRIAAQLIRSVYWDDPSPNKVVVLIDADAKGRAEVESALREDLLRRVSDLLSRGLTVLVTSAKWHLESWFIADPGGLTKYLGRDLGNVDTNNPDGVENPKHHLRQLLEAQGDRVYTGVVAREIAECINPKTIRSRSSSFADLEKACLNGPPADQM